MCILGYNSERFLGRLLQLGIMSVNMSPYDHCQSWDQAYEARQGLKHGAISIILHQHSSTRPGVSRKARYNTEMRQQQQQQLVTESRTTCPCEIPEFMGHSYKICSLPASERTEPKHFYHCSLRSWTKLHLRLRKIKNPIISPSGWFLPAVTAAAAAHMDVPNPA